MVFDNPIVRLLATRRKDSMYALACKLNIDCDLTVTSRREVRTECGSILKSLFAVFCSNL